MWSLQMVDVTARALIGRCQHSAKARTLSIKPLGLQVAPEVMSLVIH